MKKSFLKLGIMASAITCYSIFAMAATGSSGSGSSITANQVESQPNLMILLSNSYSMSKNMEGTEDALSDSGVPEQTQCAANYSASSDYDAAPSFNDGASGACSPNGTPFPYGSYGNFNDSRFYIAKQVLYDLLQEGYANGINLGFATYRQAMGMQAAAVSQSSNAIYPNIYLPGQQAGEPSTFPSPYNDETFSQLYAVGNNPLNFSFVSWWPIYNSYAQNGSGDGYNGDTNAFLGNFSNDPYQSRGLFGNVNFLNNNDGNGGLPFDVSYPQGTLQNSSVTSGVFQYSYYGPAGLTPQQASAGDTEPVLQLCQTYYNSQANQFQAIYTENNPANGSPILFQQSFPDEYSGNTLYYVSLGSQLIQNGQIAEPPYNQACNVASEPNGTSAPSSVQIASGNVVVSTQYSSSGNPPVYFNYIPNVLSGTDQTGSSLNLSPGEASGWSGATTPTSNPTVVTASYPSTPEQESPMLGAWDASGAKWMGAFVNLPSQSNPVNNVPDIEGLVDPAYPMENNSGLDYHYSTQTITNSSGQQRSIVNSSMSGSYNGHQEPLFQSLVDATAYWKAFESVNPYADCQNNNMLVIFDGISDGYPSSAENEYLSNYQSSEENALINQAKILYNTYHVKIYVVIISSNAGDITEADDLAAAGGTQTSFQASNSSDLYNEIQSTLINISKESIAGDFGDAPSTVSGGYSFAPVTVAQETGQGDLVAYEVLQSGGLNTPTSLTPSWDAEGIMQGRGSQLYSTNVNDLISGTSLFYSTGGENTITNLAANDPNDFGVTPNSSPTSATIADYTDNPSYDNGVYLGGRQNGWYVGLPTGSSPVVVTPPDDGAMLENSGNGYQTFAQNHAGRQDSVLFTANDGFLYSIGYNNNGTPDSTLLWGWMLNGLLPELQNYSQFWQTGSMNGGFTEIDAINNTNVWHSYVVGSALNGGIIYDLQLTGNNEPNLGNTVAEYDIDKGGSTFLEVPSVSNVTPAITQEQTGETQAAWSLVETSAGGTITPGIFLMNVGTGASEFIETPETPTSAPTFSSSGSLYVACGDNIYELPASTLANEVSSESIPGTGETINTVNAAKDFNEVATVTLPSSAATSGSDAVSTSLERLQISYSSGTQWITAESSDGLWTLQQSNSAWAVNWFSGVGSSAVYSNGAASTPPQSAPIQTLPDGSEITDNATVVNGTVILPVSVTSQANGGVCALPTAYYYFYKLESGVNPSGSLVSINGSSITSGYLTIGYGTSFTPTETVMNGKVLLQSAASNTNNSKNFATVIAGGLPLGGPVQARIVGYQ